MLPSPNMGGLYPPPRGGLWGPCWGHVGPKSHSKCMQNFDQFSAIDFWSIFFDVGSILGGFWEAFGGHVGLQEPLKSELKFWLDFGCIFYRFFLISEGPKPCFWQTVHAKSLFLKISKITDFSDFYRFRVPSWLPKSTQNASKIDKKLSQRDVGNMMLCLLDFYRFLVDFGPQVGGHVGAMLGRKTEKSGFKKKPKK